jgi:hypothetical protein
VTDGFLVPRAQDQEAYDRSRLHISMAGVFFCMISSDNRDVCFKNAIHMGHCKDGMGEIGCSQKLFTKM